jgi:chemosensory pili system protein ChpC
VNSLQAQISDPRLLPEHIPSLLIPLLGSTLLLPTVSVAEMAAYQQPLPVANAPHWLLGTFVWRQQQIPLLSFEGLNGNPLGVAQIRSRVAVLNHTGVSDQLPFIGILTQGIPRLTHVIGESVREDTGQERQAFDLLRVQVDGEPAVIPDICALEHVYLNWIGLV